MFMSRCACEIGLVALLSVAACSSSSSDKKSADAGGGNGGVKGGGTGGKGGKGGSAATPDSGAAGFKLAWSVVEIRPAPDAGVPDAGGATPPPLEGVKVCVNGHDEIACATSGADGRFTLVGVPPRTRLVLTFDKAGYLKESKSIETASTNMQGTDGVFMFPEATSSAPDGLGKLNPSRFA